MNFNEKNGNDDATPIKGRASGGMGLASRQVTNSKMQEHHPRDTSNMKYSDMTEFVGEGDIRSK